MYNERKKEIKDYMRKKKKELRKKERKKREQMYVRWMKERNKRLYEWEKKEIIRKERKKEKRINVCLIVSTGAKNHRSLVQMKMYIFIFARVQHKNKFTFFHLTFSYYTFSNLKTETKQMHSKMFQKRKHTTKVMI